MLCRFSPAHASATTLCGISAPSFTLAGVSLSLQVDPQLTWRWPAAHERFIDSSQHARSFVSATCSLALDESLVMPRSRSGVARWQHGPEALTVCGDQYTFGVVRTSGQAPAQFEVRARVGAQACVPELSLQIVVTLAELAGALCLHATAVEYAGRAVLLLGPSGAGKSTAAGLLAPAARCLAHDRVLVTRSAAAGCDVWALPIGRAPALEASEALVLPLAALLRVRQAAAGELPRVRRCRAGEAALYVRQAVESAPGSELRELERLGLVSELVLAAESGSADIVLGAAWSAELARFLAFRAQPSRDPRSPQSYTSHAQFSPAGASHELGHGEYGTQDLGSSLARDRRRGARGDDPRA